MVKYPLILFSFLILLVGCNRSLTKQQAEKHLKAFDSELINLSKQVSETMAYKAVHELFMIRNLPLPFQYTSSDEKVMGAYVYDFEGKKGVYAFDPGNQLLKRTGTSDSLIIEFPFESKMGKVARFVLIDYKEDLSAFGIMFPTKLNAKIIIQDQVIFDLRSSTSMAHGFPVESFTSIVFGKFKIDNRFHTKLSKHKGIIKQSMQFQSNERAILNVKSRIVAGLNEALQLHFKKIRIEGRIFPIRFIARVDQDKISPDASQFIESFNSHSSIQVYQLNSRERIGTVFLKDIPGINRLNFFLKYSDGTSVRLQEMLFGFDEIMNMKL